MTTRQKKLKYLEGLSKRGWKLDEKLAEVTNGFLGMTRVERKLQFIRQLAKFLVEDQARKSIELEMSGADTRYSHAKEWRDLRSTTPLFGYPSVEEAEKQLKEFLL